MAAANAVSALHDKKFYVSDAINSNLEVTPFGLKYVPTHTEDGIPIRKLYVSNLPPKVRYSYQLTNSVM